METATDSDDYPDVFSTEPGYQQSTYGTNERGLWAGVLEQAMGDLLTPTGREDHFDAVAWVQDTAVEEVGSFNFTCYALGFDPQAVRSRLLKQLAQRGGSEAVLPKRELKKAASHE